MHSSDARCINFPIQTEQLFSIEEVVSLGHIIIEKMLVNSDWEIDTLHPYSTKPEIRLADPMSPETTNESSTLITPAGVCSAIGMRCRIVL